jgi:hypothetical protein
MQVDQLWQEAEVNQFLELKQVHLVFEDAQHFLIGVNAASFQ